MTLLYRGRVELIKRYMAPRETGTEINNTPNNETNQHVINSAVISIIRKINGCILPDAILLSAHLS
jgi:hypothetical protein